MIESVLAYDAEPLAQGDVFRWSERTHGCDIGIIVTADCDIAFGKYGSYLTYIPVLTLHDYLARHYMPDKLESARSQTLDQIGSLVWKAQQANRPEFIKRLTTEALEVWINSSTTAEIVTSLQIAVLRDERKLAKYIDVWRALAELARDGHNAPSQIAALASVRNSSITTIHKQIHAHVTSLPGDRMYLSSIDATSEVGNVALLRNLREIDADSIALTPGQVSLRAAVRIARLLSPYRYRLTQLLGDVFSSIGLPVPYEESRLEVLTKLYELGG